MDDLNQPSVVLSKRQIEVLLLICEGLHAKEVALKLGISAKTVEYHRGEMARRLGFADTAHLVRYAIRTGLIEP